MKNAIRPTVILGPAIAVALLLAGCPAQPDYPSTITPIYAATSTGGLFLFNGSAWTSVTTANGLASNNLTSLAVIGSGPEATVFVGTSAAGISASGGSSWVTWDATDGLGSDTIHRLLFSSTVYAATSNGLSLYNTDGSTPAWTTDRGSTYPFTTVNDVFAYGSYTYIAAGATGLIIDNVTGSESKVAPGSIVGGATSVTAVFVDYAGDLIVGTNAGLAVQYVGSTSWSGLGGGPVNQLAMDAFGDLYAATTTGLYRNGSGSPVLSGPVACVCADGAGVIYAGTAAGLRISRDFGVTWTTELSGQNVTSVATTAPLYSF
jgi:hypothetical protein